jgi:hypothetical protein
VFLVAAITHDRGVILGQRQVPDKRGENTVIAGLLAPLDVAGMYGLARVLAQCRVAAQPCNRITRQRSSPAPSPTTNQTNKRRQLSYQTYSVKST